MKLALVVLVTRYWMDHLKFIKEKMLKDNTDRFIVITSINPPTEAVVAFAKWKGWQTVVVGDRKSPDVWQADGVVYLGMKEQNDLFGDFAKDLPENTYTRKMIGYIYAIKNGAKYIFESDDDNIPYGFGQKKVEAVISGDLSDGRKSIANKDGWANVYKDFGADGCWPRGFPVELISSKTKQEYGKATKNPLVVQFLADLDPDVDAIFRMTHTESTIFKKNLAFSLKKGTYCPFNSQATLWSQEAFPLMFFPLFVPDRVTDILRGYIAQTCLWGIGSTLEFRSPVVYQERNAHNLLKDFEQEYMLYENADLWSKMLKREVVGGGTADELFEKALALLCKEGFLDNKNMSFYSDFLKEIGV